MTGKTQVRTGRRRFVVNIKSSGDRKSNKNFTGCLEGKIERIFFPEMKLAHDRLLTWSTFLTNLFFNL